MIYLLAAGKGVLAGAVVRAGAAVVTTLSCRACSICFVSLLLSSVVLYQSVMHTTIDMNDSEPVFHRGDVSQDFVRSEVKF